MAQEVYPGNDLKGGISAHQRLNLTLLHRAFDRPFDAAQAAEVIRLDVQKTRRLLAYLATVGWLTRVRQGWYVTVPLEASLTATWQEDPWIVAATVLAPCYVGGWSACEHWGLTDQIFNSVYVVSARKGVRRAFSMQGAQFIVRSVGVDALFGTRRVWRRSVAVDVSDPHRTVVDVMSLPAAAGGVLHGAEVLKAYFERDDVDETKLLAYGDRLGKGAAFKRLGYLAERQSLGSERFVLACQQRVTKGITLLDPALPSARGTIVSRWNLKINVPRLLPEEHE